MKPRYKAAASDACMRLNIYLGEIVGRARKKLQAIAVTSMWLVDYLSRHIVFSKNCKPTDYPSWVSIPIRRHS